MVGGMTIGTVFTLFVVPAFYTLLARKKREKLVDVDAQPAHTSA